MADITLLLFFLTLQFLFSLQFATLWGINEEKKQTQETKPNFSPHRNLCNESAHITF